MTMTQNCPMSTFSKDFAKSAIQVVGASLMIAACSQIRIPLPFSPVPLTGQTFAIMLVGMLLGSRKGALSVLMYLLQGVSGLPVFAGGAAGLLYFFGPTCGYLVGFVAQAYIAGLAVNAKSVRTFVLLALSCAVQMTIGALWLSSYMGVAQAFMVGVYPFIIGEVLKVSAITAYMRK